MSTVNSISLLDGNQYLVNNETNNDQIASVDFDTMYQKESSEITLDDIFKDVSKEYGVNEALLKAVAQAESGFDPNAESPCGAMGIMQLMPTTAESLGVDDPFDAKQSITGGAKMLSYLLDDYNGNVTLALAAYNAGSGSVAKYGGVPPYKETVNYISKINDILGGALANDSTVVDGASATNLNSVSGEDAPNIDLKNNAAEAAKRAANLQYYDLNTGVAKLLNRSELAVNNGLMSYDDYEYFLNTYKKVFEKLADSLSLESVNENTDDISETAAQTILKAIQYDEKDSNASMTEDSNPVLKYNAGIVDPSMMNHISSISSYEGILKSNPQSLYEAQASVISPIVSQLYNS